MAWRRASSAPQYPLARFARTPAPRSARAPWRSRGRSHRRFRIAALKLAPFNIIRARCSSRRARTVRGNLGNVGARAHYGVGLGRELRTMGNVGTQVLISRTERFIERMDRKDRKAKRAELLALQRQDMAGCAERWRSFGEGPRAYRDLDGKVHEVGWHPPKRERPRCGARTRAGGSCQAPALLEKERCRMHGGLSTGPKTAEGKARSAAGVKAYWVRWRAARAIQKKQEDRA